MIILTLLIFLNLVYDNVSISLSECPTYEVINNGLAGRKSVDFASAENYIEISGITISLQKYNDGKVGWVHNDGGDKKIGLFSLSTGEHIQDWSLEGIDGVHFRDPEDISLGPCTPDPDDIEQCLYIADVGDNTAKKSSGQNGREPGYRFYKLKEPIIPEQPNPNIPIIVSSESVTVLRFTYAGSGNPTPFADCEATFIDPVGDTEGGKKGDIWLVTKLPSNEKDNVRLFKYPQAAQDGISTVTLTMIDNNAISVTNWNDGWTRADITPNGKLIVLGGYGTARFWPRENDKSIAHAFRSGNECETKIGIPEGPQSQFEALAIDPENHDLIEISECNTEKNCNARCFITPLQSQKGSLYKFFSTSPNDNAEKDLATDEVTCTSNDLDIGADLVALRFPNIGLSLGDIEKITKSYLTFIPDENLKQDSNLVIQGVNIANPSVFCAENLNVFDLALTIAQVQWTPNEWLVGEPQRSPSLNAIIRELLKNGKWEKDNAMAFVISGSGKRASYSYTSRPDSAPFFSLLMNTEINPTKPPIDPPYDYPDTSDVDCTIFNGVDFFGSDIAERYTISIGECCKVCQEYEGCKAFSYVIATKMCYLKSDRLGATDARGIVSGTIIPQSDENPENETCKYIEGLYYPDGNILLTVSQTNLSDCCAVCNSHSMCAVYVFDSSVGTCFLKDIAGSPILSSGMISGSGPAFSQQLPNTTQKCFFRDGWDYFGGDLRSEYSVKNADICCQKCKGDPNCQVFSYVSYEKTCYLKKKLISVSKNSQVISGSIVALDGLLDPPITDVSTPDLSGAQKYDYLFLFVLFEFILFFQQM